MAFPQPNVQRELANRKILEELQLKKQMLLKQGVASPLSAAASLALPPAAAAAASPAAALPMCSIPPVSSIAGFPQLPDANFVNTSQRAALHNAHATSCGFFVPQDSSFGNQILPVLPRFDAK